MTICMTRHFYGDHGHSYRRVYGAASERAAGEVEHERELTPEEVRSIFLRYDDRKAEIHKEAHNAPILAELRKLSEHLSDAVEESWAAMAAAGVVPVPCPAMQARWTRKQELRAQLMV